MRRAIALVLVGALAAACSGKAGGEAVAERDEPTSTTAGPMTPEEELLDDLRDGISGGNKVHMVDIARQTCLALDGDAGDEALAEAYAQGWDAQVTAVVLRSGTHRLCSEHQERVKAHINERAANPPPSTTTAPATTTTSTTFPESIVIYEVFGSGTATITYGTEGFSQAQESVTLPWRKELRGDVPDFPVLVAQLDGTGDISCKIWGGGTVPLAESTSSGPYVVVTCADD